MRRVALVLREPIALRVMQLLKAEKPSGTELGHIIDLVRDACGGDLKQLANDVEVNRFCRSINHPAAFGMRARHAISRHEAPPNPMDVGEVVAFARKVASEWLRWREAGV